MAKQTDTTSIFRSLALFALLLLLTAAALVYLGSQGGGSPELAALSQSIPQRTADAIAGRDGAFDALQRDVNRLAQLRRSGNVPGATSDWQQLESRASAVLSRRAALEALGGISGSTASILESSNELLTRSGSTAVIQEFQRRAREVADSASGLTRDADPSSTIADMARDVNYLRSVHAALSGEATSLDVVPLDGEGRTAVLEPLGGQIDNLMSQLTALNDNVGELSGLDEAQAGVAASAGKLAGAFTGSGMLPGFLSNVWIPVGLVLAAALLIIVLVLLNVRMAKFERMARDQADQNERNQQAILRLLDEMGSLADGDLTVEATVTEDITGAIADAINYAIEALRDLVYDH